MTDGATQVTIDELHIAGEPGRWRELGFAVQDGGCQLGGVLLRLTGAGAKGGIVGWSLRGLRAAALDGLATAHSSRPLRTPAPRHPNGVLSIDHVVAFSPQLERTVCALRAAGLDLRRVRDEPTPAGAPRQAFFRLGAEILEVIQMPPKAVVQAGGQDGPARLWGLALVVDDIDAAVAALGPHAGAVRDAVQPGRRIVTLQRSAGLSVPVALMTPAPSTARSSGVRCR